jgi:hypothetical protein
VKLADTSSILITKFTGKGALLQQENEKRTFVNIYGVYFAIRGLDTNGPNIAVSRNAYLSA